MRYALSLQDDWTNQVLHAGSLMPLVDFVERWMEGHQDFAVMGSRLEKFGIFAPKDKAILEFTPDPVFPVEYVLGNPYLGFQMVFHQPANPASVVLKWDVNDFLRFSNITRSKITAQLHGKPALQITYPTGTGAKGESLFLIAM